MDIISLIVGFFEGIFIEENITNGNRQLLLFQETESTILARTVPVVPFVITRIEKVWFLFGHTSSRLGMIEIYVNNVYLSIPIHRFETTFPLRHVNMML